MPPSIASSWRVIGALLCALIVLWGGAAPAHAQDSDCRALIPKEGAVRKIDLTQRNELDVLDYSLLKQVSSKSRNLDATANAKFPVEGVPIDLGGTLNSARSKYAAVESSRLFQMSNKEMLEYRLIEGDPVLAAEFNKCISLRGGLIARFEKLDDRDLQYKVSIRWVPAANNQSAVVKLTGPIELGGIKRIETNTCERQVAATSSIGQLLTQFQNWAWPKEIGAGGCDLVFTRSHKRDSVRVTIPTEAQTLTISLPGSRRFIFEEIPYPSKYGGQEIPPLEFERLLLATGEVTGRRERAGYSARFADEVVVMPDVLRRDGWVFKAGSEKPTKGPNQPVPGGGDCNLDALKIEDDRISWNTSAWVRRGDTRVPCPYKLYINLVRLVEA